VFNLFQVLCVFERRVCQIFRSYNTSDKEKCVLTGSKFSKNFRNPYFGFLVIIAFIFWVLVSEYGTASISGDLGALIWISFHFIVNPILGLLLSIFLVWIAIKQDQLHAKIFSLISTALPLFISYAGFTGNIWFVELLGINLK